jgi:hypothetical protein
MNTYHDIKLIQGIVSQPIDDRDEATRQVEAYMEANR